MDELGGYLVVVGFDLFPRKRKTRKEGETQREEKTSNRDIGCSVDMALTVFLGLGTMGEMADIPPTSPSPELCFLCSQYQGRCKSSQDEL